MFTGEIADSKVVLHKEEEEEKEGEGRRRRVYCKHYLILCEYGYRRFCYYCVTMNSLVRLSLNYKSFSLRSVQISQYLKSGQRIRHLQSSAKPRQAVGLRKGKDTRLILEHEYAVKEDTLLFRYENKNYVRFVNIFAICQLVFWTHLSYSAFSYMKDIPVSEDDKENKDLPFWRKINLGKFRTGITAGCILVGGYHDHHRYLQQGITLDF